jgi:hypothetical protein
MKLPFFADLVGRFGRIRPRQTGRCANTAQ